MKTFRPFIQFVFISLLFTSCIGLRKLDYETSQSNVLYAGIGNPIQINNHIKNPITISSNIGTVERIDSSLYIDNPAGSSFYVIYPDTIPGKLILTISQGKKKQEKEFRVREIPNLKAIATTDTTKYNTTILSASNFRTFRFLTPILFDFDLNCKIELLNYQITRVGKDGTIESKTIINPNKGPNMANQLAKKAEMGDIYLFEKIKILIHSSDDKKPKYSKKLSDVIYYIK